MENGWQLLNTNQSIKEYPFPLRGKARMRGYIRQLIYLSPLPNPLPKGEGVDGR